MKFQNSKKEVCDVITYTHECVENVGKSIEPNIDGEGDFQRLTCYQVAIYRCRSGNIEAKCVAE